MRIIFFGKFVVVIFDLISSSCRLQLEQTIKIWLAVNLGEGITRTICYKVAAFGEKLLEDLVHHRQV